MSFKFELGTKVQCKITGYEGIITGRTEWLYGCRRYTVQAREMKDGKPVEAIGADEDALDPLDAPPPHKMKTTGGPQREPARRKDAKR